MKCAKEQPFTFVILVFFYKKAVQSSFLQETSPAMNFWVGNE